MATSKLLKITKTFAKYAVAFVVIYALIGWWRQPTMPANPTLQLTDTQGQSIDLDAMSQQAPVLVYFWGSWCGACRITSPSVQSLYEQGYSVVSIAVQSGSDQEINQYMKQHQQNFPVINDDNGRLFAQWKGQATPSFVVLNQGKMTQGLSGIQTTWSLKIRLWLNQLF